MNESVYSQVKILKELEEELRGIPSDVVPAGEGVDSPKYREQTQRLEALMPKLSLAIKAIENSPHSKGPDAQKALKSARELEKRIREAEGRAVERNMHELLADGLEQIHQYHGLIEVPDQCHSHASIGLKAGSSVDALVPLFSILARYVQWRKRAQKKKA